ncbi:hypothetical protein [Salibacterium qingdaonense]|uniref:Uncharacterized protein n=1 Tax=Salibacterium qingdaonense TaxID=266892 RepID=A0A1I4IRN4_9BACI|nr:hypothetical protein [Salibacterium qingdaonense]SFL56727.1 hypothetical protein SAMN04488054_102183 [Salibacterium qingdaonense]
MFNQLLLWATFILPWFALIPLNNTRIKKVFPSALFGTLILTFVFQVADRFEWWQIEENIFLLTNITSFVYGLFFAGTIIILYFTHHHFWLYMTTNLIIDAFLSFMVSTWYEHLGIYELININSFGVYALTTVIALLIYSFQKWQETVIIQK